MLLSRLPDRTQYPLRAPEIRGQHVAITQDGSWIVTDGDAGCLIAFPMIDTDIPRFLVGHAVAAVVPGVDDEQVLVFDSSGALNVFRRGSFNAHQRLELTDQVFTLRVLTGRDRERLLVACSKEVGAGGTVRELKWNGSKWAFAGPTIKVASNALRPGRLPDGRWVVGGFDEGLAVLRPGQIEAEARIPAKAPDHALQWRELAVTEGGDIWVGGDAGILWRCVEANGTWHQRRVHDLGSPIYSICPWNEHAVLVGTLDGRLAIAKEGGVVDFGERLPGRLLSLAVGTVDGDKHFAAGTTDGRVHLLDERGQVVFSSQARADFVRQLAFSRDGTTLWTATRSPVVSALLTTPDAMLKAAHARSGTMSGSAR